MKKGGSNKLNNERLPLHLAFVACVAMALIGTGGCSSDGGEAPAVTRSQAQQELDQSSKKFNKPVFEETKKEGSLLGGLLGAGLSIGDDRRGSITIPTGLAMGSAAGQYVASKQKEYSEEVDVIVSMTKDIRAKNEEADRTIKAMEVVVAEHRALLKELMAKQKKGEADETRLSQEVAQTKSNLKTMKSAIDSAEQHLKTFSKARDIVFKDSDTRGIETKPESVAMNSEIDALRSRIDAMRKMVDDMAEVG